MKAVSIDNSDKSLHIVDVPVPKVSEGECLLKVFAAGVNRADLLQREGKYPPPPGCPDRMGLEVSGEVVSLSESAEKNSPFRKGDRVCALLGGGGYAQYVSVRYDMMMPIPDGVSMIEAAAMPEAFATAYLNLFREGGMKAGDTVLVFAGSSGLSSVVIPMAKAFGARVLTTLRKPEQVAEIAHLNADRVIVTTETDLALRLKEEADLHRPVSLVLDCLGGQTVGKCLPFLSYGARWIVLATLAGDLAEIDLKSLYVKNVRLIGSTLRSRPPEVKAQILSSLVRDVWPLVSAGKIRPTVDAVFPIEQVDAAQAMLYEGKNVGKVVLTLA